MFYEKNVYVAARENAYSAYYQLLNAVDVVEIECKKHLALAKKNKDLFMVIVWQSNLFYAGIEHNKNFEFSFDYFIWFFKIVKNFDRLCDAFYKKSYEISEMYLEKLNYRYMVRGKDGIPLAAYLGLAGCIEDLVFDEIFYSKESWFTKSNYKKIVDIRCRFKDDNPLSYNNVMLTVDYVELLILRREYRRAKEILVDVLDKYKLNNVPVNSHIFSIHLLMANISFTTKDYVKSILEYIQCLELAKQLHIEDCYDVRVGIVQASIYAGYLAEAQTFNNTLFTNLKEVDETNRKTYWAEWLYNEALLYLYNNVQKAKDYFRYSINEYYKCNIYSNRKKVGIARCEYELAKLNMDDNLCEAISYIEHSYKILKSCLGYEHKETIECKKVYDMCKSLKKDNK